MIIALILKLIIDSRFWLAVSVILLILDLYEITVYEHDIRLGFVAFITYMFVFHTGIALLVLVYAIAIDGVEVAKEAITELNL